MEAWIAGIVATVVGGVLVWAIKWLISDWYKKSNALQSLRTRNTEKLIKSNDKAITALKATVEQLDKTIKEHQARLASSDKAITEHKRQLEQFQIDVKTYVRECVRSELIQLTDQLMIIKGKNGKKGNVGES